MTLSSLVLNTSAALQTIADAVHSKVVLKTLRKSAALKAKGLDLAFQEADKLYWYSVDEAVAANAYVEKANAAVKLANANRERNQRALLTYLKKGK